MSETRERAVIRYWKELKPSKKHFVLMYIYRLHTDIEHITDYLETYEFMKLGITLDDLPEFIAGLTPRELRIEAYDVIGKLKEIPKESA